MGRGSRRRTVSPSGRWGAISDSNPEATFGYFAERLNAYGLAYLHVIEPRVMGTETLVEGEAPVAASFLRKFFKGPIIAAGRWFSSNPDLPERLRHGHPLTPYIRDAFWGGDERAYIDFPAFAA